MQIYIILICNHILLFISLTNIGMSIFIIFYPYIKIIYCNQLRTNIYLLNHILIYLKINILGFIILY